LGGPAKKFEDGVMRPDHLHGQHTFQTVGRVQGYIEI
jgi:hypothetical protein